MRARKMVVLAILMAMVAAVAAHARGASATPAAMEIAGGWQMQDSAKVPQAASVVASAGLDTKGWYAATVPGTVLTTLVNNHVYPEPLYGENDRPEVIPESLARGAYWYRAVVEVPKAYGHRQVWLNFDGINYSAEVWVNGTHVGDVKGAFVRGIFDVTELAKPGKTAVVAVLIHPEPTPGDPHEHTVKAGVGKNGGVTGQDGPTFLCTIGWDWLPAMRDRDSGIWQKVFLSSSGAVRILEPQVTTDMPLPRTDVADVTVRATVENLSDKPVRTVLAGDIEGTHFEREVQLAAKASERVTFDAANTPTLHMEHPRLWWPNGYGEPNLYQLKLHASIGHTASDASEVTFGVRKITYTLPGSDNLAISVNGVPVFIRGGNWGLDEGMKRMTPERMEAIIRLHRAANLNLIRNWVGQSTSELLYEMCDKYGILLWDEFFQANPSDGPNPTDTATYLTNVRDKIVRFRNHPAIAVWCARNEGYPPKDIDAALGKMLAELDPGRLYQSSSTDGRGVRSHGPYRWRAPREFYTVDAPFKSETGSLSVPTLESIHGMMPQKDWENINDDWAEHDFTRGNQGGDKYPGLIAARYGAFTNLADFVRKAQLANYEAFRAMYEGRNAQLFHPTTGIITWMSNPAQPSFVWQIYHYDLEPMSSFFAVMHAGEMVHIQYNEADGRLQVVNNLPKDVTGATAHVTVYNVDGTVAEEKEMPVTAAADSAADLGVLDLQAATSAVRFLRLELKDVAGTVVSRNFYWLGSSLASDDLTGLNQLPKVELVADVINKDTEGFSHWTRTVTVTLHNPSQAVALMAHIQLRRKSGERVLPAYYSDNYVSLAPGEERTLTVEADAAAFHGEDALVVVDGWNVSVKATKGAGVSVETNVEAQPEHWPVTGLPLATTGLR